MPAWSADGRLLAYYGVWGPGAQRGIGIVPAAGGEEHRLTLGAAVVWTPAWSPDGRYLYVATNQSGVLNLARVVADPRTGRILGPVEPVTAGIGLSVERPTFSRDGRRLLARAGQRGHNIARVRFDARRGRVEGRPEMLTRGANAFGSPDVSPDGAWITFHSAFHPGTQEDIYVARADGTDLRRLTDDQARDRDPRFVRDGKRIVFFSDRSGVYEVWTVDLDGSNLRSLGSWPGVKPLAPKPSTVDDRIAVTLIQPGQEQEDAAILDGSRSFAEQTAVPLPLPAPRHWLVPARWSPDGRELYGTVGDGSRIDRGIVAYDPRTQRFRNVWPDVGLVAPLRDGRRVLIVDGRGRLLLVEPEARRSTPLLVLDDGRISVGPSSFSVSRDERWVYFEVGNEDADVWLAELR